MLGMCVVKGQPQALAHTATLLEIGSLCCSLVMYTRQTGPRASGESPVSNSHLPLITDACTVCLLLCRF